MGFRVKKDGLQRFGEATTPPHRATKPFVGIVQLSSYFRRLASLRQVSLNRQRLSAPLTIQTSRDPQLLRLTPTCVSNSSYKKSEHGPHTGGSAEWTPQNSAREWSEKEARQPQTR